VFTDKGRSREGWAAPLNLPLILNLGLRWVHLSQTTLIRVIEVTRAQARQGKKTEKARQESKREFTG
jgi:hypothetical protein